MTAPSAPPLDGTRLRFVLSTGRTGTVFLNQLLGAVVPDHEVEHEPRTSRRVFMLRNAAEAGVPLAGQLALSLFLAERRRRLDSLPPGHSRIEVNPFLGPLAADLPRFVAPLRVVHMIRDPRTWIPSMTNFKAAGWRRHVIDAVPFARPVHPLARAGWLGRSRIERAAWWWRTVNERILTLPEAADRFVSVRYEDLFLGGPAAARTASRAILECLADVAPEDPPVPGDDRVNPGRQGRTPAWQAMAAADQQRVLDICGDLMERFGYDPAAPA